MKTIFKKDGFTLVELIVVIAILAILAAVAIPAYSGYIEKANTAGDEQLLNAVNKAFASACVLNGDDIYLVENVKGIALEDGKIPTRDGVVAPYGKEFWQFYGDNKDAAFKNIKALFFNHSKGAFEAGVSSNGITASTQAVQTILGSTWFASAGLTSGDVLDMVNNTAIAAQTTYSDIFKTMSSSADFKAEAEKALGLSAGGYDAYYNSLVDAKVAEMMAADPELSKKNATTAAKQTVNSNMATLVAAQNAQSVDIMTILTTGGGANAKENIKTELTNNPTSGLSQSALAYGMYHAWIYSQKDLTNKEEKALPGAALNDLDNEQFQTWLGTDQAKADLAGLLAALETVSGQDSETAKNVVSGGFDSEELEDALEGILGK